MKSASNDRQTVQAHHENPPNASAFRLVTLGDASLLPVGDAPAAGPLLGPGKPLALLVYLDAASGRTASREHLVDLLWADLEPDAAKHALRQTVWYLRQRLGAESLVTRNGDLLLRAALSSDVTEFLSAIDASNLEHAMELYAGDFLPEFRIPGGLEFEHWADLERQRLRRVFVRAGEVLVRRQLSSGQHAGARELARRVRDADSLGESGWRLLLESTLAAGDMIGAAAEADRLQELLRSEDRVPEPATRVLLRRAREEGDETGGTNGAHTLVAELIGRERDFATVIEAWAAVKAGASRHIHVTAPAGLGKTRLLKDVYARLRAGGSRVVSLRANPGERQIPFAFAGDLAGKLGTMRGASGVSPAAAGVLVALNPSLSSYFAAGTDRARGPEALRHRTLALAELIAAVADEAAVAILIDDTHWLDAASRQVLTGLVGRSAEAPVLIVTAGRPQAEAPPHAADTERLSLDPLAVEQVNALLVSLGSLPAEPWVVQIAERLHRATSGSPLLVLETLQLAVERESLRLQDSAWTCLNPEALSEQLQAGSALRHRIENLDREQSWPLLLLAVAGAPVQHDLLRRIAGSNPDTAESGLQALEHAGMARRAGSHWETAHDEIADAVVEFASADALRAAHATLGTGLLEAVDGDLHRLARAAGHLAQGEETSLVQTVFREFVVSQRRRGDRRTLRTLANELLGDATTTTRCRALVRGLPAYVRFGLTSARRVLAAAGLIALIGTGAAFMLLRTPLPADGSLIAMVPGEAGAMEVYAVPLRRSDWSSAPIDIQRDGVHLPVRLTMSNAEGLPAVSPDGTRWVFARSTADSGGIDLFLVDASGDERRLTYTPGDDREPSWSPDGRMIVFSTAQWNEMSWYDLAIIDIETGEVTPLKRDQWSYADPSWSPDGTRIAFHRANRETGEIQACWTVPSGKIERCLQPPAASIIGWQDGETLVVYSGDRDSAQISLVAIDAGTRTSLLALSRGRRANALEGGWLAAQWPDPDGSESDTYLAPIDRPDLRRPIRFRSQPVASIQLAWSPAWPVGSYVDRIVLLRPESVPLNAPYRLQSIGITAAGYTVVPRVLTWQVSDTSIATIDTSGTLLPRRAGVVTVSASDGGWRDGSTVIRVGGASVSTVFAENWERLDLEAWGPFGVPEPEMAVGPRNVPAFSARGNGGHLSGAYSRITFSATRGLGMDILISTPITVIQWQEIHVFLTNAMADADLVLWDHREGLPPGHDETLGESCGVRYPPAGRLDGVGAAVIRGTVVASVPSDLGSGAWFRLRIQLFPDGSCGVALNGDPVIITHERVSTDGRFRVFLAASSVETLILHGPLEVWEGVRDDIDWRVLDPRYVEAARSGS